MSIKPPSRKNRQAGGRSFRASYLTRPIYAVALLASVGGLGVGMAEDDLFKEAPQPAPEVEQGTAIGTPEERGLFGNATTPCDLDIDDFAPLPPATDSIYRGPTASFRLDIDGTVISDPLMTTSVMPGDTVTLEALDLPAGRLRTKVDRGQLDSIDPNRWQWHAPEEPGLYRLLLADRNSPEALVLNTFVKRPWDGSPTLNGYAIGRYAPSRPDGNPRFARPTGFIEVTPELEELRVSPHFQLGAFVCKQSGDYPKYLLLETRLLDKLERLVADLNRRGIPATSLTINSGYRTPLYNTALGNETTLSRHLYGDAADIVIDVNGDGVFDNIDGRGQAGLDDIFFLRSIVESLEGTDSNLIGGFGAYEPIPGERGPFAHIDVRGEPARWVGTPDDDSAEVDSIDAIESTEPAVVEERDEEVASEAPDTSGRRNASKKRSSEPEPVEPPIEFDGEGLEGRVRDGEG